MPDDNPNKPELEDLTEEERRELHERYKKLVGENGTI